MNDLPLLMSLLRRLKIEANGDFSFLGKFGYLVSAGEADVFAAGESPPTINVKLSIG